MMFALKAKLIHLVFVVTKGFTQSALFWAAVFLFGVLNIFVETYCRVNTMTNVILTKLMYGCDKDILNLFIITKFLILVDSYYLYCNSYEVFPFISKFVIFITINGLLFMNKMLKYY